MLAGCSTTDKMDESEQETVSEEERRIRREEVRANLRQYQLEVIRAGMPPLPIPMDGIQVTEKNNTDDQAQDIFKPELSHQMRQIIHAGCIREMEQAYKQIANQLPASLRPHLDSTTILDRYLIYNLAPG